MQKQSSVFQVVILAIFGVSAVVGVMFFALGNGFGGSTQQVGEVLIWGSLDAAPFNAVISRLAEDDPRFAQVEYVQRDPRTFYADLSDAIAGGRGPDLILLSNEYIMRHADKIMPFSYEVVPQRTFEESFIQEATMYLTAQGVLGIPIAVDPLVLYWNKDLLVASGFSQAPQYWDELFTIAEKVTKKDDAKNILVSAVGFGEYENVAHAKDVLSTLIMQAGGEITTRDASGKVIPGLLARSNEVQQPAQSALRFYTEFANPTKSVYTWNRSLQPSREAFAAGDVALYVGYASEYSLIQAQNPNLNYAVALLPQIRDLTTRKTFGEMQAFAVPRGSLNPAGAQLIAFLLGAAGPSAMLSEARGTPSPHLDVLGFSSSTSTRPEDSVFRDSALFARAWFDPDPSETERVFKNMIEGVTSGALRLQDAVSEGDKALQDILNL